MSMNAGICIFTGVFFVQLFSTEQVFDISFLSIACHIDLSSASLFRISGH